MLLHVQGASRLMAPPRGLSSSCPPSMAHTRISLQQGAHQDNAETQVLPHDSRCLSRYWCPDGQHSQTLGQPRQGKAKPHLRLREWKAAAMMCVHSRVALVSVVVCGAVLCPAVPVDAHMHAALEWQWP